MKDAEVLKQNNFYKKAYAKYVLVKLEYLSCENSGQRTFEAISIEHVLPQKPKHKSDWNKKFDENQREEWTNSVANLILLSKRKNSSASNLNFKDKKDKYFSNKITDLPRSLQILKADDWTPTILKKRMNNIITLMLS